MQGAAMAREEGTYRLIGGDYSVSEYGQRRWELTAGETERRASEGRKKRGKKRGESVAGSLLKASAAFMQRNLIDSSDGESDEDRPFAPDAHSTPAQAVLSETRIEANRPLRLPSIADDPPGSLQHARPPYADVPTTNVVIPRLPEAGLDDSPEQATRSQGLRSLNCSLNPIRRDTQSVSATPQGLGKKSLMLALPTVPSPQISERSTAQNVPALTCSQEQKPERMLHKATAAGPATPASVELILDMQLSDLHDVELFKREVASDVAVALGPRATNVRVLGLRAGSIVAQVEATPLGGLTTADIKEILAEQCQERSSLLLRGKHTAKTTHVIDAETGQVLSPAGGVQGGESPLLLSLSIISSVDDVDYHLPPHSPRADGADLPARDSCEATAAESAASSAVMVDSSGGRGRGPTGQSAMEETEHAGQGAVPGLLLAHDSQQQGAVCAPPPCCCSFIWSREQ
jgi:hypothetical protein